MSRTTLLVIYCLGLGSIGWAWLLLALPGAHLDLNALLLFGALALLLDCFGFRVPPDDPHTLVGPLLLAGVLALGAPAGALVAAVEGLLFGILLPLIFGHPRTFLALVARPVLRSGARAAAILLGTLMANLLSNGEPSTALLLLMLMSTYIVGLPLIRGIRELLQGGVTALRSWWRSSWRPALVAELAPLPLALLLAEIWFRLGPGYLALACAALMGSSLALRQGAYSLLNQRRSMRELERLNEVSRAIIRAELNVDALCELIYREASKVVDTSSFHLGLFSGDQYTLKVRVQDRVRLPELTVSLAAGDGLVGWMRQTGKGMMVSDFLKEMDQLPARPRYNSDHPPRSGIYVPLIAGPSDEVIGSISVQSYRPNAFDADDVRLLSLIADQAAVAITKAHGYAKAQQRAIQLQAIHEVSEQVTAILDLDRLLPSVVQLIRQHFGYHPVHIFTIEADGRLTFRASTAEDDLRQHVRLTELRLGDGLVGTAAQSGKIVLVDDVRSDTRYIHDTESTRSEMAVPLCVGDETIGVLDVQSTDVGDFDEDDQFVIQTLADQIAIAIDSARSYTAQQEEAWTLNGLLQASENITRASTLDDLLSTAVRLPSLLAGCDRCICLLRDRESDLFLPRAVYGLPWERRTTLMLQRISAGDVPLLAALHLAMRPIIAAEGDRSSLVQAGLADAEGGELLALPLVARGAVLGVLLVELLQPHHHFNARQLTICGGIASQMAVALESALLALEAAEAARMEQELLVARDIQTALLPSRPPETPGWQLATDWRSARQVGGDFYDFWRLTRRLQVEPDSPVPLGFVIADVSDKGVPAAMFMALARSLVRAAALDGSSPSVALMRANRWITRDSESGMFVTLFYGLLDLESGELRYSCAGHNPPLLFHAAEQRWEQLSTAGIALGVIEEVNIDEAVAWMEPGDLLLCYTDGVTESINAQDEPLGIERVKQLIVEQYQQDAHSVVRSVTALVYQHTADRPPFDDVTVLVLKRDPLPATGSAHTPD